MRNTTPELTITVTVADRASTERQLDEAVSVARAEAMSGRRRGILVTRYDFDTFGVALSDAVSFGQTREHQEWPNAPKSTPSGESSNADRR